MSIRAVFRTIIFSLALALCVTLRADVEVDVRQDTVILNDGTEIQCLIVMMSPKGVVVVQSDPKDAEKRIQRTVLRADIRSIVLGEKSQRTEELMTDTEMARKVILGKASAKESTEDEPEKKTASAKANGPKRNGTAKKSGSSKTTPEAAVAAKSDDHSPAGKSVSAKEDTAPLAPEPDAPIADAPVERAVDTLSTKEVTDAYLGRYSDLKGVALDLAGAQRLQEWLDGARNGNPAARKPVEGILKGYLATPTDKEKPAPIKSALQNRIMK